MLPEVAGCGLRWWTLGEDVKEEDSSDPDEPVASGKKRPPVRPHIHHFSKDATKMDAQELPEADKMTSRQRRTLRGHKVLFAYRCFTKDPVQAPCA